MATTGPGPVRGDAEERGASRDDGLHKVTCCGSVYMCASSVIPRRDVEDKAASVPRERAAVAAQHSETRLQESKERVNTMVILEGVASSRRAAESRRERRRASEQARKAKKSRLGLVEISEERVVEVREAVVRILRGFVGESDVQAEIG